VNNHKQLCLITFQVLPKVTQPQIIETREFPKDALIVFPIVRIEATNKHGMVIVKEIDIITMSKLWMKLGGALIKSSKIFY
jgi:hypothetical protein